jgi:hypothetical protein
MTRAQEQRLLQLVGKAVLLGSGNMEEAEVKEMRFLCDQHGVQAKGNVTRYCACGCGEFVSKQTNKYIQGHSHKAKVSA